MNDKQLYGRILGIESPWRVEDVELKLGEGEVVVKVEYGVKGKGCPTCGQKVPAYDHKIRRWRHLDTCQYKTILEAKIDRVNCPEHGIQQMKVPWAEPGSRFTAMLEALVISWLKEASIAAVSKQLNLSWTSVDRIMNRAVQRGLDRRQSEPVARIGVDETSYRKGHRYLTVVTDLDQSKVLFVEEGRKAEQLEEFYSSLQEDHRQSIQSIAMDMWPAFINATMKWIPGAETKICFDKFHVAQHLSRAVDRVRRKEHKSLASQGDTTLKGTKFLWLRNPQNMPAEKWNGAFKVLRTGRLKTGRAWAIKEEAMDLWHYRSRAWALKAWKCWYGWAIRSRLDPVKEVARMVKKHLEGILNAIVHQVTNAGSESMNAKIQRIKRRANGFRNNQRFKTAIYFHLGGLDLSLSTHTIR